MSPNTTPSSKNNYNLTGHFQTFLLGLISFGVAGIFKFVFDISNQMTHNSDKILEHEQILRDLSIEVKDHERRLSTLEKKQP
jgi:hypothetical protein